MRRAAARVMKRGGRGAGPARAPALVTVEAALLMTLIIPLLTAVIVFSFYLHDRAYLQAACTELAAMGNNLQVYEGLQEKVDGAMKDRLTESMMWTKRPKGTAAVSEVGADVQAEGSFAVPGLVTGLFGPDITQTRAEWSRNIYHPAELIWTVRSVKYVVDLIREK